MNKNEQKGEQSTAEGGSPYYTPTYNILKVYLPLLTRINQSLYGRVVSAAN